MSTGIQAGLARPWFLAVLLVLVPLLVYCLFFRDKARYPALGVPFISSIFDKDAGRSARWRWLPASLQVLGMVLLVLALARPRSSLGDLVDHRRGTDLVLVLDTSTSMRAADMGTGDKAGGLHSALTRIGAAKQVMERFVESRPNDRLGLVVFAGVAMVACPLTFDRRALLEYLEYAHAGMLEDGTAIGDAVALALAQLKDSPAKGKAVILLTDGRDNRSAVPPRFSAEMAKVMQVRIHTVLMGTDVNQPVPFFPAGPAGPASAAEVPSDPRLLSDMAGITGGVAGTANDVAVLQKLFERIDSMEKTDLPARTRRYKELFQVFAGPGLGFLVLGIILDSTRYRRLP